MNRALPGASEAPPASLIDEMPVNDRDRHVPALAVHTGAPLIVTENLRDFPHRLLQGHEVEAVSADDFVVEHVESDPDAMNAVIEAMAVRRRRDAKTRHDIIAVLACDLPQAMAALAP